MERATLGPMGVGHKGRWGECELVLTIPAAGCENRLGDHD